MKKSEIKPGVLYGYTRSRDYGQPQPIVFLNTPADGELYRQPRRYGTSTGPAFTRDHTAPKPQRGGSYTSSPVGYPAVLLPERSDTDPSSLLAVTLADFEAVTSAYGEDAEYTVITSLAQIIGPYAEACAEFDERQRREREERERRSNLAADRRRRAKSATDTLQSTGIFTSMRGDDILLTLENAEKLAALLIRVELAEER